MDSAKKRREAAIARGQREADPRKKQASNATALVVLGLILFAVAGATTVYGSGEGPGGLLLGILGVGLVVAGIVIRPRP